MEKMTEQEAVDFIAKKAVLWGLIYGAQGFGKNLPAKAKLMQKYYDSVPSYYDGVGTVKPDGRTELPQKVCNYGKPKLEWYGQAAWINFIWNDGFTMSRHWDVLADRLHVRGADPKNNMDVFRGKRFIGISEPTESEQIDNDFLKRLTGDEWVETKTLNCKSSSWKPQGKIFVMSGKPLKINEKSQETIEQVRDITYPETT